MKHLLIYYNDKQLEKASWLIADEDHQTEEYVHLGPLNDLANYAAAVNLNIIVIVPGSDVIITSAILPKMNQQRVLQALPYVLEEKLIDDVQQLHFAVGPFQGEKGWPVLVTAKSKMDLWVKTLENLGLKPNKIVPAPLCIPCDPPHIYLDENLYCYVRMNAYDAFTCEPENLITILNHYYQASSENDNGQTPLIHFYDNANPKVIDLSQFSQIKVIPCQTEKNFLEQVLAWSENHASLNLLQGAYQAKHTNNAMKKVLVGILGIFILSIGLLFTTELTSLYLLAKSNHKIELAIQKIYREHFPDATSIVAPRERMEAKLKKASRENKDSFIKLLNNVSLGLNHTNEIKLLNLNFQNNLLNVTISSASFSQLDSFIQNLKNQKLNVKQQNADMVGSQVKANLMITQK